MARIILAVMALLALPVLAADGETKTLIVDVAKGGALGGLVTAATLWLYSLRKQRTQISPDPLNIKGLPLSVKEPTCDAKHEASNTRLSENRNEHDNIFPRLASIESRVSVLEGTIAEIKSEYQSIDTKLTVLLRRR